MNPSFSRLWVPFLGLVLANCLLVFPPAFPFRPILLVLGWGLPLLFLWRSKTPSAAGPNPFDQEVFQVTPWALLLLFSAALAVRMTRLDSLFLWPGVDEALKGFLALSDNLGSKGGFFRGFDQSPPTFIACVGALLRWTHSPLFSLWFPSAAASILAVALNYGAARLFFSRSLSFLATAGLAFGYWPLFTGRTGFEWSLFLVWGSLLWIFLGLLQRSLRESPPPSKTLLFLSGLATGLGSLVSNTWPIVALGVALLTLVLLRRTRFPWSSFAIYSMGSLLALVPFLRALGHEDFGGHILASLAAGSPDPGRLGQGLKDYFSIFFWGSPVAYAPKDMGYMNPLTASFFGLGIWALGRSFRDPRGQVLVALALLWTLPALLLFGVEPFRLTQLMPLLFLVVGIGIQSLVVDLPKGKRVWMVLGLLAVSGGWDLERLARPYGDLAGHPERFLRTGKSLEKLQAYRTVTTLPSTSGPGFFFSELVPETVDLSLAYMTLPTEGQGFPQGPSDRVQWLAFLAPLHDLPGLKGEFPGLKGELLPSQTPGRMSDHFLAIKTLSPADLPRFKIWWPVLGIFWKTDFLIADLSNGKSRKGVLEFLMGSYPDIPKEPFLQSCFFEKLLHNYSWERTFHPEDTWANWANFSRVFTASYRSSYQDEVLERKFGQLMTMEGLPVPAGSKLP